MKKLEPERQAFLDARFTKWLAVQPDAELLRGKLLAVDGLAVVPPPNDFEPDIEALLLFGRRVHGQVVLKEMAINSCHWNVARLWRDASNEGFGIGTGYGLNGDLWRQHSWAMHGENIIETTEIREVYFGICYFGKEAETFSELFSD